MTASLSSPATRPLLERDAELSSIDSSLSDTLAGTGSLIVVEGGLGSGRSALLDAAAERAFTRNISVLRCNGVWGEDSYRYGLLEELLYHATATGTCSTLESAGVRAAIDDGQRSAPDVARALFRLFDERTTRQPTLIAIDDLQLADGESVEALRFLASRLHRVPVSLIVAVTPQASSMDHPQLAAWRMLPGCEMLRPKPLSPGAVTVLVESHRQQHRGGAHEAAAAEQSGETIWVLSAGNPLAVTSLCESHGVGPGQLHDRTTQLTLTTSKAFLVSVQRLLTALGPVARRLALSLAVLGDRASLAHVAALAGCAEDLLSTGLSRLVGHGLVTTADGTLSFAYPALASAVRDAHTSEELAVAHRSAGAMLHHDGVDDERVAVHVVAGLPTTEQWAIRALHRAGQETLERGEIDEALRYLRRAAAWSNRSDQTASLLLDLGRAEFEAGNRGATDYLERAVEAATEPVQRRAALNELGYLQLLDARATDARATFARCLSLCGTDTKSAYDYRLAQDLSEHFGGWLSEDAIVPELGTLGHGIDWSLDAQPPMSLGIPAYVDAVSCPPVSRALQALWAAIDGGELLADGTRSNIYVHSVLRGLVECGDWVRALPLLDRVVDDAVESGSLPRLAEARSIRARANEYAGNLRDAMADARAAIQMRSGGLHLTAPVPDGVLMRCLMSCGRFAEAAEALAAVNGVGLASPSGFRAFFHVAKAQFLLRTDPAAALQELLPHVETLGLEREVNPNSMQWRPTAAHAAMAIGDSTLAFDLVESEIGLAARFETRYALGIALSTKAELLDAVNRADAAEALMREAIEVLEPADAPLPLARALLGLGLLRHRSGRRDAREHCEAALDLAARCGASELEREAEKAARSCGARPRRHRKTGVSALTPREREVAEQAATGYSNSEIATSLYVSEHTVKWHLARAFRKLAVNSRDELGAALGAEPQAEAVQARTASTRR